ncbi:MAG: Crp/Fnr family transcriptional regulator [Bacteroidales bacterium]
MTNNQNTDKETLIPFGSCLTDEEIEIFQKNSNIVTYNKRENIFRQSTRTSHIMFVKSGLVKIFKEGRNNKFIILKIATPGEYLGLISIFGNNMHQYSASAVDSVEVCFIDLPAFTSFVKENGEFAMKIIGNLSNYAIYIFDRLMSQSHKQLPGRIADVILYFAENIFKSHTFEFPFTRRELAELAGTTKESFIRTLAEFKNDKIIQLNGSEVTINSIKIIKTLSNLG